MTEVDGGDEQAFCVGVGDSVELVLVDAFDVIDAVVVQGVCKVVAE